ncbi:hypothetical protein E2562_000895 [Oryza meyeriana var. granulata]|uniref:HAT C-terminal dimerisation domain-containing protein n=1 Tax=Oryza meyeriana var. granulata TaxID=110450 RepID=A0A6G1CY88_9ORYZ|nr:hypothetical protein E2562_000895 [Oryza meyeriana var. granulata]
MRTVVPCRMGLTYRYFRPNRPDRRMGGDDEVARSDGASTEPEKQDTTEKVQEEQPEKEVKRRKAMAPRSEVWESFIKITVGGELMKAKWLTLWDKVNYSFRALFDEYRNIYASHDKPQQSSDSQGAPERTRRLMRSLIAQKMRLDNGAMSSTKSELEKYLAEENEEDKDFDILEWWKDNANRFPVLSRMARDLLAIPISTVASESAFSTALIDDLGGLTFSSKSNSKSGPNEHDV